MGPPCDLSGTRLRVPFNFPKPLSHLPAQQAILGVGGWVRLRCGLAVVEGKSQRLPVKKPLTLTETTSWADHRRVTPGLKPPGQASSPLSQGASHPHKPQEGAQGPLSWFQPWSYLLKAW